MSTPPTTRRQFLRTSAATALIGVGGNWSLTQLQANGPATPQRSLRLGAPIFNPPEDPEELAREHRKRGLRAAYCPGVSLSDTQRIRDIERAFSQHDVVIAEVGRWKNLLAADPAERQANREFVIEGLALADEVGTLCCVDIAGSYNADSWFGPHPDNLSKKHFDESVENARKIIDAVKPKRARFCFEMMGWALPDTPASYVQMLKAVDRTAFGVHLDPANLINSPAKLYRNTDLLNECFDKLGPSIVSCHAKDVAWQIEMQVHFTEVVLGAGEIDYTTYLQRLAKLPHDAPLMIEHMQNAEEYDQSRRYVFEVGKKAGISFGE